MFGDVYQQGKVMAAKDPKDVQRFGRKAQNFNGINWENFEEEVMREACYHKFSNNKMSKHALLKTGTMRLGESSHSKKWGTGMTMSDPRAFQQDLLEQNLLGKALTEVRDVIRRQEERERPHEEGRRGGEERQ